MADFDPNSVLQSLGTRDPSRGYGAILPVSYPKDDPQGGRLDLRGGITGDVLGLLKSFDSARYGQPYNNLDVLQGMMALGMPEVAAAKTGTNTLRSVGGLGSVADRIGMHFKDVTKRVPELTEAAQKVASGEMTREEYGQLVNRLKPVTPYETVPPLATDAEMQTALTSDKKGLIGAPRQLEEGHPVGLRLDIPAYRDHGTWVASVHEQRPGWGAGPSIGYDSFAAVTNPFFGVVEKAAQKYAKGDTAKNTFATIKGNWKPMKPEEAQALAQSALKDPQWRQVGMDPERHSFFYDRETQQPVASADEVVQIGPLVLAKNPKPPSPEEAKKLLYSSPGLGAPPPVVTDERNRQNRGNVKLMRDPVYGTTMSVPEA